MKFKFRFYTLHVFLFSEARRRGGLPINFDRRFYAIAYKSTKIALSWCEFNVSFYFIYLLSVLLKRTGYSERSPVPVYSSGPFSVSGLIRRNLNVSTGGLMCEMPLGHATRWPQSLSLPQRPAWHHRNGVLGGLLSACAGGRTSRAFASISSSDYASLPLLVRRATGCSPPFEACSDSYRGSFGRHRPR